MQSRASATSLVDEHHVVGNGVEKDVRNGTGNGRSGNGLKGVKEWPSRLARLFCVFLLLGAGVVLGVVSSLSLQGSKGVFNSGMLSSYISGSVPAQQHYHLHIFANQGPQSLQHGMGDQELLWRASMVPLRPGLPIRRTPKVAFMFLTVGPLPLASLWEKFFKGHEECYSIYVHSLPQYEPNEQPSSVFFGRHILSREVKWGDISMNDAERRLLANALLDFDNEHFVLLSESCAPLWSFTFTYNYIMNSNQSFVGAFDDPGPVGRGRYDNQMAPEVTIEQWRKGAQWFEVSRDLAIFIVSDVKYYDKFRQFCVDICYSDEHYIPTMMHIEFPDKIAERSVTAVDWSRGGWHPGSFGRDDAEGFYQRIRGDTGCTYNDTPGNVCYLFARKFRPDSLESLLKIAAMRKLKLK